MLMILDCLAIAHRVKHAMADLSFREKKTGIIFGFLCHVLRYAEKFRTNAFVFAWDSRKSYRSLFYPGYKDRHKPDNEKTEEELKLDEISHVQFHELRAMVIPALGFVNNFMQIGLEADDVIAVIVRDGKQHQAITDITVVSRDNDLYQLLDDCDMFDPQTNKLFTKQHLFDKYGVTPQEWLSVKILAGCSTDRVGNIPGIGIGTAIKYLKGSITKGAKFDNIISENGRQIVQRNFKLVGLPHEKTKIIYVNFEEELYLDDFVRVFEDYGFESFLKTELLNKWRKCFKLK